MSKLVCVHCEVGLKIEKSGVVCIEYFNEPPKPYKLWFCDAWKCPRCGHIVLSGFAKNPFAVHYEEDFGFLLKKCQEDRTRWVIREYEL